MQANKFLQEVRNSSTDLESNMKLLSEKKDKELSTREEMLNMREREY